MAYPNQQWRENNAMIHTYIYKHITERNSKKNLLIVFIIHWLKKYPETAKLNGWIPIDKKNVWNSYSTVLFPRVARDYGSYGNRGSVYTLQYQGQWYWSCYWGVSRCHPWKMGCKAWPPLRSLDGVQHLCMEGGWSIGKLGGCKLSCVYRRVCVPAIQKHTSLCSYRITRQYSNAAFLSYVWMKYTYVYINEWKKIHALIFLFLISSSTLWIYTHIHSPTPLNTHTYTYKYQYSSVYVSPLSDGYLHLDTTLAANHPSYEMICYHTSGSGLIIPLSITTK